MLPQKKFTMQQMMHDEFYNFFQDQFKNISFVETPFSVSIRTI